MMHVICGSSDAGAINYFQSLKKYVDLTIVDNLEQSKSNENVIYMTGAALGDSLDKKIIRKAAREKKKCVSIIDHWSWYRKRFEFKDGLLLPDLILVNDEIAFFDAIKDGIPESILRVVGNPVLEQLKQRKFSSNLDPIKLRNKYKLPKKRIIVFISEELASKFNNSLDDLGYDEYKTLDAVIKSLGPFDHLVIKLHPEEEQDKYIFLEGINFTTIKNMEVFELDSIADVVIGMASMLLLELAMLRDDVISFRPNANKDFIGNHLKATINVNNQSELQRLLLNPQTISVKFREGFNGSGKRIAAILKDLY